MKALNISIDAFLSPLVDDVETVCLHIFSDKKGSAFKGAKLECAAGKIARMTDTLNRHNQQDRGVFFVVNFGGHEDSEIAWINA